MTLGLTSIYWCSTCQMPIAATSAVACLKCGEITRYLTTDIRPVFTRERRILQYFHPQVDLLKDAVWKSSKAKSYFVNGKTFNLPPSEKLKDSLSDIADYIHQLENSNSDYYDQVDALAI